MSDWITETVTPRRIMRWAATARSSHLRQWEGEGGTLSGGVLGGKPTDHRRGMVETIRNAMRRSIALQGEGIVFLDYIFGNACECRPAFPWLNGSLLLIPISDSILMFGSTHLIRFLIQLRLAQ